jgi:GntR family transcriptional regulator/MocR family aminotransferase
MHGILLNKNGGTPLKRQLYEALRQRILMGQLEGGEAMPSTRALAASLGLSRSTVLEAYEMLSAEGYLVSKMSAPTRVEHGLALPTQDMRPARPSAEPEMPVRISFQTGRPELRAFPRRQWQAMLTRTADTLPLEALGYGDPQGMPALRQEIAAWLLRSRGLAVSADDLYITAGTTHALHLLSLLMCTGGRRLAVEDPCNSVMLASFRQGGAGIVPVAVDAHGLQTDRLPLFEGIAAVYTTPSHQFPLGGILPASRRAALVRYARAADCYIVEDDYDSEFRFAGEPVAPLWSMEPQRVVYVGTFSKSLFPALRIGFAVLPRALRAGWLTLRTHTDVQNPPFAQVALAEFLRTRKMDRHVHAMRRLYGRRRAALLGALAATFGSRAIPFGDASGLHIAVAFPKDIIDARFLCLCKQRGLFLLPLESHCLTKGRYAQMLLLGYSHLDETEINEGVRLLADVLREREAAEDM